MRKRFISYFGKEEKPTFNDFGCYHCSNDIDASVVECEKLPDNDGVIFLHMTGICEKCIVEIDNKSELKIDGVINDDELQEELKLFELSLVMES